MSDEDTKRGKTLPETIWRDGEQPGIPYISSCSEDQEGPSQPHLVEITCTSSCPTVKLMQNPNDDCNT